MSNSSQKTIITNLENEIKQTNTKAKRYADQIQECQKRILQDQEEYKALHNKYDEMKNTKKQLDKQLADEQNKEPLAMLELERKFQIKMTKRKHKIWSLHKERFQYTQLVNKSKEQLAYLEDEISEKISSYKTQIFQKKQLLKEISQRIELAENIESKNCDKILQLLPSGIFLSNDLISSSNDLETKYNQLLDYNKQLEKQIENLNKMKAKFLNEIELLGGTSSFEGIQNYTQENEEENKNEHQIEIQIENEDEEEQNEEENEDEIENSNEEENKNEENN